MVTKKEPFFVRNKVNWVLILSAASAVIYLSSYLFQLGYNSLYNVPSVLISLDWAKISFSLLPILIIIIINIVGIEVISIIAGYDSNKAKDRKRAYLSVLYLDVAVLFSAVFITTQTVFFQTLGNAVIGVILVLCCVIIKYGPDKFVFYNPFSVLDRLMSSAIKPSKKYKSILGNYIEHPSRIILGMLYSVIFGFLVVICGTIFASLKTDYLVSVKDQTIVLNTFGDKAVVDQLGQNNILQGHIAVIDITQDKDFQVKQVKNIMTQKSYHSQQKTEAEEKKVLVFMVNVLKAMHLAK
jgi:hypothetical protein